MMHLSQATFVTCIICDTSLSKETSSWKQLVPLPGSSYELASNVSLDFY